MSSSKSPADTAFVADASVIINLNATGRAAEIIAALPHRLAVPGNACLELKEGARRSGHDDARQLQLLIDAGAVDRIEVRAEGTAIYMNLIDGSARYTLDDGEAAAIACAIERQAFAVLDERKARGLCAASFPSLPVRSTAELLMDTRVAVALGKTAHVNAVFMALQRGRMRVPPEHLARILLLIGDERASLCRSLPLSIRLQACKPSPVSSDQC